MIERQANQRNKKNIQNDWAAVAFYVCTYAEFEVFTGVNVIEMGKNGEFFCFHLALFCR